MKVGGYGSIAKRTKGDVAGSAAQLGEPGGKSHKQGARRILVAAEKLFGEYGINGVSLRQILAAAGHGNKSAVYDHFGSREGLIAATYDLRMPALEKVRHIRLREADRQGPVGTRELLEALFFPFVEISPASARRACAKFHSQLDSLYVRDPAHPRERWRGRSSAAEEIDDRLRAELKWLPNEVFDARFALVVELVLTGIARIDHNDVRRFKLAGGSAEKDLINIATAALCAPWP